MRLEFCEESERGGGRGGGAAVGRRAIKQVKNNQPNNVKAGPRARRGRSRAGGRGGRQPRRSRRERRAGQRGRGDARASARCGGGGRGTPPLGAGGRPCRGRAGGRRRRIGSGEAEGARTERRGRARVKRKKVPKSILWSAKPVGRLSADDSIGVQSYG